MFLWAGKIMGPSNTFLFLPVGLISSGKVSYRSHHLPVLCKLTWGNTSLSMRGSRFKVFVFCQTQSLALPDHLAEALWSCLAWPSCREAEIQYLQQNCRKSCHEAASTGPPPFAPPAPGTTAVCCQNRWPCHVGTTSQVNISNCHVSRLP